MSGDLTCFDAGTTFGGTLSSAAERLLAPLRLSFPPFLFRVLLPAHAIQQFQMC